MSGVKIATYLQNTDLIPGSGSEEAEYKFHDLTEMYQSKGRQNPV